ncbi:MAG TPA: lipoprotein insertase outer membrane protein LolB [Xanthomonadaceae bacterium]|nr:lipoprotein insertase outer membrane protein LolB [Xanthomonadaceae bacterium]
MRRGRGWIFAAIATCLLAACAGQPLRAPGPTLPPDIAQARQAERETALAMRPRWSLQGRVAVSTAGKGGSGRIDWSQEGPDYVIALSAPVTRQSWRLRGTPGHARLEGLDGGPREGDDATELLLAATGWLVPVDALAAWVRGARAAGHGAAAIDYGADGQLAALRQDGWTLHYADWRPAAGLAVALPHRVEATRGEARVRLVVDAWGEGP